MTDKDIIKALECCNSPFSEYRCCDCPLYNTDNCKKALRIVSLDLINRQQAEISVKRKLLEKAEETIGKQQAENKNLEYKLLGVMHFVDKWLNGAELEQDEVNRASAMREKTLQIVEKQQAEIERLTAENNGKDFYLDVERSSKEMFVRVANQHLEVVKVEAIKEFAERLKKNFLALEYQAKTARKTLPVDFVKDQMKWLLHEVSVETIDNLVKEMVGEE